MARRLRGRAPLLRLEAVAAQQRDAGVLGAEAARELDLALAARGATMRAPAPATSWTSRLPTPRRPRRVPAGDRRDPRSRAAPAGRRRAGRQPSRQDEVDVAELVPAVAGVERRGVRALDELAPGG